MVPPRFDTVFPEVSEINIAIRRMGRGLSLLEEDEKVLDPDLLARKSHLACGNPICHRGGYQFKLIHIIWEMTRSRKGYRRGVIRCPGIDRVHKKCPNRLAYRIRIAYDGEAQSTPVRLLRQS